MTEQYLILHKVRGEPSFDCAEKIMIGDEEGWITNSGYRAYPVWSCKMTELGHYDFNLGYQGLSEAKEWYPMPADWPDHFEVRSEGPKVQINFSQILSGLSRVKFKRRM